MDDLDRYIEKQMQDPCFKAEYENSRQEFAVAKALRSARIESGMTQKELAKCSGVRQSKISRIECGMCSPSLATLQALAVGLGKKITITIE